MAVAHPAVRATVPDFSWDRIGDYPRGRWKRSLINLKSERVPPGPRRTHRGPCVKRHLAEDYRNDTTVTARILSFRSFVANGSNCYELRDAAQSR